MLPLFLTSFPPPSFSLAHSAGDAGEKQPGSCCEFVSLPFFLTGRLNGRRRQETGEKIPPPSFPFLSLSNTVCELSATDARTKRPPLTQAFLLFGFVFLPSWEKKGKGPPSPPPFLFPFFFRRSFHFSNNKERKHTLGAPAFHHPFGRRCRLAFPSPPFPPPPPDPMHNQPFSVSNRDVKVAFGSIPPLHHLPPRRRG